MTERLLQFIWQFQYYSKSGLSTTANEELHIINPGQYNCNQGPDFGDGRIRLGNTTWAGSIELHLKTSDWKRHKHHDDKQYGNVILHVVWEDDGWKNEVPVLELKDRVSKLLLNRYEALMQSAAFIACGSSIQYVPSITWSSWKQRLLVERLTRKSAQILEGLQRNNFHWEEVFWIMLARNFGMKVNAEAFEAVARSINTNILAHHKHNLQQLEALLLGQAGLLDGRHLDSYSIYMQKEYRFLRKKYAISRMHLAPLFLRMRPGNFPGIRLAQLAMIIHTSAHLFSAIRESTNLNDVVQSFDICASDYWDHHYKLGEDSAPRKKKLGGAMINNIIINTVAPLLFSYGLHHDQKSYKEKALVWLEQTEAEGNAIIRGFAELGIHAEDASISQSLIELKNEYCNAKRCLECSIGNFILKRNC